MSTSTFSRDASGWIVVNLSRGPALNPELHSSELSAAHEARRLAMLNPNQTFQVFRVKPAEVAVLRWESKTEDCWFPVIERVDGDRFPLSAPHKTRKEALEYYAPGYKVVDAINIRQPVEGWHEKS